MTNQLKMINRLNSVMNANEMFRAATSLDDGVRNVYNVNDCVKIIELYNYLYKHSDLLSILFKDPNPYMCIRIINDIHHKMSKLTAAQAVKTWINENNVR